MWGFKFLLLEGDILQFQGKSKDIVNLLEPSALAFTPTGDLEIKQEILLSMADARLGMQQRSVEELKAAQQLSQETHSALQSEVLRTQGLLEDRRGEEAAAEQHLTESLDVARQQKDEYLEASDLLNLGAVALHVGHFDEALDRFNASSLLAEKVHAELVYQTDLGNAGSTYNSLGDFERALSTLRQAQMQARRLGATDSEILWLQDSGLSLSRLGDVQQAKTCYEDALSLARSNGNTTRQAEIETSLGLLYLEVGQLDIATRHADEALAAAKQIGNKSIALDVSLLRARIAARTSKGAETEQSLMGVLADTAAEPSVRWQAQNELANLYASRNSLQQAERWHRRAIQTLEFQRESVQDEEQRLPFLANGDDLYRDYAEFLIATNRSDDALRVLDGARGKTLREGLGKQHDVALKKGHEVSALAHEGVDAILFYSLGPQRSYLWALDRKGAHLFVLPPEAEITARVKRYQESILRSRDPLAEANADALWLYDKLVAPAEALVANGSRVLVIPDGSLNAFNFETLLKPGSQGNHYWIDDVSVTTAASVGVLASSTPREVSEGQAGKLLLIGDPVAAGGEYGPLPHARAELEDVQRYFPGDARTTITQAAAVPSAYAASRPEQYAYLHFVAHGMASREQPLDSAIVLSPPANDPDHFKLYARDILAQPLHARLVTISACYGSGVRNYAGEGMVGLTWAFLRAGAHQVIGTLWEVNDSSTPALMEQMYRGISLGETPDKALRAAKLSMLHSQGVFRKPFYWAAFELYTGS